MRSIVVRAANHPCCAHDAALEAPEVDPHNKTAPVAGLDACDSILEMVGPILDRLDDSGVFERIDRSLALRQWTGTHGAQWWGLIC